MNEIVFILAGGFALGVAHSFDPYHLAALSTLVGPHGRTSGTP